jgi:hypothetical protein
MSAATFAGQSDNQFGYRSALAGGAGATLNISDVLGVRSELLYVIRGALARDAVIDGEQTQFDVRFAIAYVDVPVLLVARLPLAGAVSPYIFAGGAYSRNVDARVTVISPSGAEVTDSDTSIRDGDFSIVGGAGLFIAVSTEEVFIEGRFVGGRQNVRPDRADAPLNNRSFLIVAGIRF